MAVNTGSSLRCSRCFFSLWPSHVSNRRRERAVSSVIQRTRRESIYKQRCCYGNFALTIGFTFIQAAVAVKCLATAPPTRRALCWYQSHPPSPEMCVRFRDRSTLIERHVTTFAITTMTLPRALVLLCVLRTSRQSSQCREPYRSLRTLLHGAAFLPQSQRAYSGSTVAEASNAGGKQMTSCRWLWE